MKKLTALFIFTLVLFPKTSYAPFKFIRTTKKSGFTKLNNPKEITTADIIQVNTSKASQVNPAQHETRIPQKVTAPTIIPGEPTTTINFVPKNSKNLQKSSTPQKEQKIAPDITKDKTVPSMYSIYKDAVNANNTAVSLAQSAKFLSSGKVGRFINKLIPNGRSAEINTNITKVLPELIDRHTTAVKVFNEAVKSIDAQNKAISINSPEFKNFNKAHEILQATTKQLNEAVAITKNKTLNSDKKISKLNSLLAPSRPETLPVAERQPAHTNQSPQSPIMPKRPARPNVYEKPTKTLQVPPRPETRNLKKQLSTEQQIEQQPTPTTSDIGSVNKKQAPVPPKRSSANPRESEA